MLLSNCQIPYNDFFRTYFPDSALIVASFKEGNAKYMLETIPNEPLTYQDCIDLYSINKKGYGVYFTPNGLKEDKGYGATHSIDNFNYINACYTDIDIKETKVCYFEEDFKLRIDKKAEIAGHLFFSKCPPSIAVETRNGFQCYWLTSGSLEQFKIIQKGIYEKYKDIGADWAATKEVQLMRVPGFLHDKEDVVCELRHELSTWNEDGSIKYYKIEELEKAFPYKNNIFIKKVEKQYKIKVTQSIFNNLDDIFRKILKLPILEVMERINGTKLTGGEIFTFGQEKNGKIQIKSNGKTTPNWIDLNKNMIFSNNIKGFCNPIHFAQYYGLDKKQIAEELKTIFKR